MERERWQTFVVNSKVREDKSFSRKWWDLPLATRDGWDHFLEGFYTDKIPCHLWACPHTCMGFSKFTRVIVSSDCEHGIFYIFWKYSFKVGGSSPKYDKVLFLYRQEWALVNRPETMYIFAHALSSTFCVF